MNNDKDIKKIGKILSDTGKSNLKEFDIVFLIDATSSMGPYIEAAKITAENISKSLRQKFPETNFQYGYVFYRDPIDSYNDIHEIINLTDNVNSLPEQISKIKAEGGADIPEDWAGAYKKVNEEINWRNGTKVIFHLADAGAHGNLFTPYDKYPNEEQKLINELEICCEKKVKIFGFVIEEDSRNSFEKCKNIYSNKGGFYEICNFDKPKNTNRSLFGGSLFENKESKGIFGAIEKKDDNHGSLFGCYKEDNNKNYSLFNNNIEKKENNNTLFGSFIPENKDNSNCLLEKEKKDYKSNNMFLNSSKGILFGEKKNETEGNLFGNNNTNSIFGNKKEDNINKTTSLFGDIKMDNTNNKNGIFGNKKEDKIFENIKKDNNSIGLFGNIKEDKINNNSGSLFGNKKENNTNNYTGSLFENIKEDYHNSNDKGNTKHEEGLFQSKINSSFFNLVVNSIQNINKNEGNIFNNNINNFNN